jgi:hypothetical protein
MSTIFLDLRLLKAASWGLNVGAIAGQQFWQLQRLVPASMPLKL